VGYSRDDAQVLAYFTQFPDETTTLDAIAVEARARRAVLPRERARTAEVRDRVQTIFHALTGGDSEFETAVTVGAIGNAGDDLTTTGLLLHRLGDSFAHREIGNESKVYDTGLGHARDSTDPDKVLRRPQLYEDYLGVLVDVLGSKRNLSAEERNRIKGRISIFNVTGAEAIGAVLGRTRNPGDEHDSVEEIVRDYLIRGQQVVRHRIFDAGGQDSTLLRETIERCVGSNPCLERAFEFRIKDRLRRKHFAHVYEPEKEDFGLEHGIFLDKDIDEALEDIKYRQRFRNPTFQEDNIRRAVQRTVELVEQATSQETEIRKPRDKRRDRITGIVKERRR
jgi:hypothetical protein